MNDAASINPAQEGDGTKDYSISLLKANLLGAPLFLALAAAVTVPFGLAWGWARLLLAFNEFMNLERLIPSVVVGTIVHEGLHGIGWAFFGRIPLRAIRYGFSLRTLTPYAHCPLPLPAAAYRRGTLLPGIVLGLVPALVGVAGGSGFLIIFAAFFLGAASGDFLCLWIMRSVAPEASVTDHPTRAGCVVACRQAQGAYPVPEA